jgi:hypothetical protein
VDCDARYGLSDLLEGSLNAERPLVAAPHQDVSQFIDSVFDYPPNSPRSLVYHGYVTLSAALLGFALGGAFGIILAVLIVHVRTMEKSLLPWIICSQMVPILAVAPIVIVVLGAVGLRGLLPKSIISAYLCFFPVVIGMVKGLNSPDPIPAGFDAHLVGDAIADILEAPMPMLGSVPVREHQGGDHDLAGRRDRGRIADRRPGRPWSEAPCWHILRPDPANLGRPVHGCVAGRRPGRHRGLGGAMDAAPHGAQP